MDGDSGRVQREIDAAWELHRRGAPPLNRHGRILWGAWKPDLLERLSGEQNHRCCHCGTRMRTGHRLQHEPDRATFDHAVPLAEGGFDTEANLVVACYLCNQRRGHREQERRREARFRVPGR